MSLSIGIVGLPNVGKSTIFNALTKSKVEAANYPFCTIDPHTGCIKVPDIRVDKLSEMSKTEKKIHAMVEFVDIAGLVKGAHQGEGLGNKFLSNIRETNAIVHVLRQFESSDITHVENRVNPKDDLDIINLELLYADQEAVNNAIANNEKKVKAQNVDKDIKKLFDVLQKCKEALDKEILLKDIELDQDELKSIKSYGFLTLKPALYVLNVTEEDLKKTKDELLRQFDLSLPQESVIPICAKLEEELSDLSDEDVREYLNDAGIEYTGLEQLIRAGYHILGLITFLTTGEKETRAWTIKEGSTAPQAAGEIHTDFEKSFIRAEVVEWDKLLECGSWAAAREKGLVRLEGKDYIMKDGDTVIFKTGA